MVERLSKDDIVKVSSARTIYMLSIVEANKTKYR